jgi:hypothetical protein
VLLLVLLLLLSLQQGWCDAFMLTMPFQCAGLQGLLLLLQKGRVLYARLIHVHR